MFCMGRCRCHTGWQPDSAGRVSPCRGRFRYGYGLCLTAQLSKNSDWRSCMRSCYIFFEFCSAYQSICMIVEFKDAICIFPKCGTKWICIRGFGTALREGMNCHQQQRVRACAAMPLRCRLCRLLNGCVRFAHYVVAAAVTRPIA